MQTIGLLLLSNIFMTIAWYGHLKFRDVALWQVVLISWLIALFEYCLQVPANRIGSYQFSAFQLRIMQEIIGLLVFSCFAVWYLGESLRWNHLAAFLCLLMAVFFAFRPQ